MTEIQSPRPKAKDVVKDFLARNPQLQTKEPKETLELADRKQFEGTLLSESKAAAQKISDEKSVLDPTGAKIIDGGQKSKNVPITKKILDPSIPIVLNIEKSAKWAANGDFINEGFSIGIYKGEEEISTFAIRNYGDEFRLSHRYVNPKFREQGFGGIMLRSLEELVKEYSKINGRSAVIDSFCSQLDVMAMYDSNGYESVPYLPKDRPHHFRTTEVHMLDDIMAEVESGAILEPGGDAKYKLGEKLYVLPRKAKASVETDPRAQIGVGRNIAESVRVHFRKNLDAEIVTEDIGKIRETTSEMVMKKSEVLGRIEIEGKSVRILRLDPDDISDQDLNEHARNLAHMNAAPRKDIPDAARKQQERQKAFIERPDITEAELKAIYPDMCEEEHFRMYGRRGSAEKGDQGSYTKRMAKGTVFAIEMDGRIVGVQAYERLGKTKAGRTVLEFSKASTLEQYKGKKINPNLKKFLAPLLEKQEGQTPIWFGASVNPKHLANFVKRGWHITDMDDPTVEAVQLAYLQGKDYIDENMIPQGYKAVYADPLVDNVNWEASVKLS
jgi:hypothetical protein